MTKTLKQVRDLQLGDLVYVSPTDACRIVALRLMDGGPKGRVRFDYIGHGCLHDSVTYPADDYVEVSD